MGMRTDFMNKILSGDERRCGVLTLDASIVVTNRE